MPPRKRRGNVKPAGQIRQSQIVSTYGPGALVDLPDYAVLVAGLENWAGDGALESHGSGFSRLGRAGLQLHDVRHISVRSHRDAASGEGFQSDGWRSYCASSARREAFSNARPSALSPRARASCSAPTS